MNIREIETVSLPRDLKQYSHDEKFVAFEGGYVSEPMSYGDAVRLAAGRGGDTAVGFLLEEPAVKLDYSQPLPGILSRKGKRKTHTVE